MHARILVLGFGNGLKQSRRQGQIPVAAIRAGIDDLGFPGFAGGRVVDLDAGAAELVQVRVGAGDVVHHACGNGDRRVLVGGFPAADGRRPRPGSDSGVEDGDVA